MFLALVLAFGAAVMIVVARCDRRHDLGSARRSTAVEPPSGEPSASTAPRPAPVVGRPRRSPAASSRGIAALVGLLFAVTGTRGRLFAQVAVAAAILAGGYALLDLVGPATGPRLHSATVPADELKPAYLIAGTDAAKIDAALARLRARAEREGGPGALEVFPPQAARRARRRRARRRDPDDDADDRPALPARRRRRALDAKQAAPVADGARATLPAGADGGARRPRGAAQGQGAEGARGRGRGARAARCSTFEAPKAQRSCRPGWPRRRSGAASRSTPTPRACSSSAWGTATVRLGSELDRLAHLGRRRRHRRARTSRRWSPTPPRRPRGPSPTRSSSASPAGAVAAAERLAAQGEAVDAAHLPGREAAARGAPRARRARPRPQPKEVERSLAMHPYAAKMLVRQVQGASAGRPAGRELRGRRPRVVDPRRGRLSGGSGADAGGAPRGRCPALRASYARRAMRAARAFLRAPLFACRAPFWTALSIRETRPGARSRPRRRRRRDRALEPAEVGANRAGKRRFSMCSRSVRAIRFFCEAMLAMDDGAV